ncbi:MAG: MATE family efflux transporter, partial [Eubacterium sp.]|nr:MATE family efflux transporter [Eubacterium sp.]
MSSVKKKDNLMTQGSIAKRIILFAIPIFIGQLFQQLYNTVDSLIVGNLIGSSALAAVSATGTLIFLVVGFFFGFSMGAGIVIAREIGAQNTERVSKAVHTAVAMGLVFSLVITVLGVSFSPFMLRLMGTPKEVLFEAVIYLRIYFLGCTGLIMYNTFVGILQASGDSR